MTVATARNNQSLTVVLEERRGEQAVFGTMGLDDRITVAPEEGGGQFAFYNCPNFVHVVMQLPKKDEAGQGEEEVNELLFLRGVCDYSLNAHPYKENENLYHEGGYED